MELKISERESRKYKQNGSRAHDRYLHVDLVLWGITRLQEDGILCERERKRGRTPKEEQQVQQPRINKRKPAMLVEPSSSRACKAAQACAVDKRARVRRQAAREHGTTREMIQEEGSTSREQRPAIQHGGGGAGEGWAG
jgi:hypothetical protein